MRDLRYFLICIAVVACNSTSKNRNANNLQVDKLTALDVNLAEPEPGEWLFMHNEAGQSFAQYIESKPVTPNESQNKIYLQPIGNFSTDQVEIIQYTSDYLELFFDRDVVTLPVINDSIIPLSNRRIHDGVNEQFQTGYILDYLQNDIPQDAIVIMAITSNDLYPSEDWNFVFGQARLKQRLGVSSLYRYCDASTNSVCLARMIKTASHEMSHMLSCKHCTHAVCVMNGSNSLWESDSRPNRLCSDCLRKLQWNLGFDVETRLKKMSDYFKKHTLERDYRTTLIDLEAMEK